MWPDRVSNPGPLTYESGALPTALRGPAVFFEMVHRCACDFEITVCNICHLHLRFELCHFISSKIQTKCIECGYRVCAATPNWLLHQ